MTVQVTRRSRSSQDVEVRRVMMSGAADSIGDDVAQTLTTLIAVSMLGATTLYLGVLTTLPMLAMLALGVPLGRVADRYDAHKVLAVAASARAILVLAIGVLGAIGQLSSTSLLFGMACVAVADAGYLNSQSAALAKATSGDALGHAFARLQALNSGIGILVPGALAIAVALISPLLLLFAASAAYCVSALVWVTRIAHFSSRRGSHEPVYSVRSEAEGTETSTPARGGYLLLLKNKTLLGFTLSGALFNAGLMAGSSALVVYVLRDLGVGQSVYLASNAVGAISGLLAAVTAERISRIVGVGLLRLVALSIAGVSVLIQLGLGVLPGSIEAWYLVATAVWAFMTILVGLSGQATIPQLIPRSVLAETLGALRSVTLGIMPLGAVVGGVVASVWGVRAALLLWAILVFSAIVPWALSPAVSIKSGNDVGKENLLAEMSEK